MSTDTLQRLFDGEQPLISWERWDRIKHTERFTFVAAIAFVALFGWLFVRAPVVSDVLGGYQSLARTMLIWAIFALGFNLLLGQTGLLSFGHAMFWGGAGYAAGLFAVHVHGDPLLMIVVGTSFAIALAFVSAFILLRMHTVYFAIVTLAIAQMLYYVVREPLEPITGGINGLTARPGALFGTISLRESLPGVLGSLWGGYLYVFIAVFFVAVVVFITRIRKSPYGLLFKAIRENETRASFVGLDVWRYKFAAFLISAAIAGLAGSLLTIESEFVGVGGLHWMTSGEVVVMTILGGLGTLVGPVVGALIFLYFEGVVDGFAVIGRYWLLLLATAFTAIVWAYPDGFWGMLTALSTKLRSLGGDRS